MMDAVKVGELFNARCAQLQKNPHSPKEDWLRALVLLRYLIRRANHRYVEACDELRYYQRQRKLLEKQRISFALLDMKIKQHQAQREAFRATLIAFGDVAISLLDGWQAAGADRRELFTLCGVYVRAWPEWKKQHLADEDPDEQFSKLVALYNLDYPENGDEFLRDEVDAPFTQAVKEHLLFVMKSTEAGRQASHEALEAVFPGLMENAYYLAQDEDGRQCLYSQDGELVGPVEPEGGGFNA